MLDDFYNRKMQLAQAMAQRSPVFKPQAMPNQIMQNEQALQQVNQANAQAALTDPGDEKRKLAEALAGKGFSKATDLWGVAANALEGYNMGRAQKEAKDEAEAKKKYDLEARQNLVKAITEGNFGQVAQYNPELAVKLIGMNEKQQNPFGSGLTGNLAALNYKAQTEGLTPQEQAQYDAIAKTMQMTGGVQYFTDAEGRPTGGALPRKPLVQGQVPSNASPPPAPPSINDAPANMFEETNQTVNADINQDGFVTKTEQATAEAQNKANIDISKNRELERPKIEAQLKSMEFMNERTNNLINEIIPKISSTTAGAVGTVLGVIPQTSAKDVQAQITTINARGIFDQLQKMRQESPTGGALGNVTEGELELLGSSVANLEASQSPEQLVKNLKEFQTLYNGILNNSKSSYQNVYGKKELSTPKSASDYLKKYGIE